MIFIVHYHLHYCIIYVCVPMVKLKTIIHPKLGILLMGILHPVNWWATIPFMEKQPKFGPKNIYQIQIHALPSSKLT